jgi:TolB-like protein
MSCATTGNGDLLGLDNAIQKAADEISADLPQGKKAAVVMFSSSSSDLSEYIAEELSLALIRRKKLTIVDRKQLELIHNEMSFQMSGYVDDESAMRIGHLLGVQFIITGSLVNSGTYYRFRTSAVNVESAVREAPVSLMVNKSDRQIEYLSRGESEATRTIDNILIGTWYSDLPQDEYSQMVTITFFGTNEFICATEVEGVYRGTYDDKMMYIHERDGKKIDQKEYDEYKEYFPYTIVNGRLMWNFLMGGFIKK